ncbi:Hypothetical protein BN69_2278 [Methylocystis sp. SC2]|nr:Hypothetical protein BN69_2278 [Methylocystis sp. SC2]
MGNFADTIPPPVSTGPGSKGRRPPRFRASCGLSAPWRRRWRAAGRAPPADVGWREAQGQSSAAHDSYSPPGAGTCQTSNDGSGCAKKSALEEALHAGRKS